jgi:hypothetical protein
MEQFEISAMMILAAKVGGWERSENDHAGIDLHDADDVIEFLLRTGRYDSRSKAIDHLNDLAEIIHCLNPAVGCYVMDGLLEPASSELMHHTCDGAQFYFDSLPSPLLTELRDYTAPRSGEAPTACHQRWQTRIEQRAGL